ncbi:MAG: DNA gyrase C-terminal beta-propeller domain-containing protein, partial [Halodesulfurarchaeum sp.]
PQSRNGKGFIDIKTGGRNGAVSTIQAVTDEDHVIGMSERGQIIRLPAAEVSEVGRNTKGVKVMDVESGDRLASISVFSPAP